MNKLSRKEMVSLVMKAQKGDRSAFARLYTHTSPAQYFNAFGLVRDEELAREVVQNTYLYALKKINDLKAPEAFLTWLSQITYHQSINMIKKKERDQNQLNEEALSLLSIVGEDTDPVKYILKDEKKRAVLNLIGRLSLEHRSVIMLRYYQNRKVSEIADITGCSVGTVKSRLHYAHRKLKEIFRAEGISGSESLFSMAPYLYIAFKKSVPIYEGKNNIKLFRSRKQLAAGALTLAAILILTGAVNSPSEKVPAAKNTYREDSTPPAVDNYRLDKGTFSILFTDSQSGVDESSFQVFAEDGSKIDYDKNLHQIGEISFKRSGGKRIVVIVSDLAGNRDAFSFTSRLRLADKK